MSSRPGIYTSDIFKIADAVIKAGWFREFADLQYALLLIGEPGERFSIRRGQVDAVLPKSFRVWLVKGRTRYLLGESSSLPADLSAGVFPPYF